MISPLLLDAYSGLFSFLVYPLLLLHGTHTTLARENTVNYDHACTNHQNTTNVPQFTQHSRHALYLTSRRENAKISRSHEAQHDLLQHWKVAQIRTMSISVVNNMHVSLTALLLLLPKAAKIDLGQNLLRNNIQYVFLHVRRQNNNNLSLLRIDSRSLSFPLSLHLSL